MLICEELIWKTLVAHGTLEAVGMNFRARRVRTPDNPSNVPVLDCLVSAVCNGQRCSVSYGGRVVLEHAIDGGFENRIHLRCGSD